MGKDPYKAAAELANIPEEVCEKVRAATEKTLISNLADLMHDERMSQKRASTGIQLAPFGSEPLLVESPAPPTSKCS